MAAKESAGSKESGEPMSQYFFTFEIVRQYPTVRSYIIKQLLRRSFKDALSELIGGGKG